MEFSEMTFGENGESVEAMGLKLISQSPLVKL